MIVPPVSAEIRHLPSDKLTGPIPSQLLCQECLHMYVTRTYLMTRHKNQPRQGKKHSQKDRTQNKGQRAVNGRTWAGMR